MYVVCVTVWVKEGQTAAFLQATGENHRQTRQEPGNVRFDVLRCADNDHQFFLYEVYRDQKDFVAHQQTAHYLAWKATVADLMAQPRQGVKHLSVFPDDQAW